VSVTDNLGDPVEVEASVSVPNSVPEIATVVISPSDPLDNDDLSCAARASDPDGVDPTLTYTWYRDGVAAVDVGDTTTVTADLTTVGDVWECEVAASDGVDTATLLSSGVTIRDPVGYRVVASIEVTLSTDSSGASTASGSAEWDVWSGGGGYATNDCSIYWSVTGVEDTTICRGCTWSFAADYVYEAALSSVASGCASLPADSGGELTEDTRRPTLNAVLDDVSYSLYSFYPGYGLRFSEAGSGGYSYSYGAYSRGRRYEVLETVDAYGRTVLSGYSMRYFYY
jgi:hypothetical protein